MGDFQLSSLLKFLPNQESSIHGSRSESAVWGHPTLSSLRSSMHTRNPRVFRSLLHIIETTILGILHLSGRSEQIGTKPFTARLLLNSNMQYPWDTITPAFRNPREALLQSTLLSVKLPVKESWTEECSAKAFQRVFGDRHNLTLGTTSIFRCKC